MSSWVLRMVQSTLILSLDARKPSGSGSSWAPLGLSSSQVPALSLRACSTAPSVTRLPSRKQEQYPGFREPGAPRRKLGKDSVLLNSLQRLSFMERQLRIRSLLKDFSFGKILQHPAGHMPTASSERRLPPFPWLLPCA